MTFTVIPISTFANGQKSWDSLGCTRPQKPRDRVCQNCSLPRGTTGRVTTSLVPRWTLAPEFTERLTAALK